MVIAIRKFKEEDIPYKVTWINNENNNKYLHYDLPLTKDNTLAWYKTLVNRNDRADYTITYNDEAVGLIGLLNIDKKNKKAEYYVCIGNESLKGKGIAVKATNLLIEEACSEFRLQKIYLYTETGNIPAQKLFEKVGFIKEGLLRKDLIFEGKSVDRYLYGLDTTSYKV